MHGMTRHESTGPLGLRRGRAAAFLLAAGLMTAGLMAVLVAPGRAGAPADKSAAKAGDERNTIWTRLSRVRLVEDNNKTQPEFDASVMTLDGKELEISGFIMPLEQGEKQKHFLISPYPQSCPFCSPFGPEGLVEVLCKEPIALTFKAVTLKGKFALLRNYDESGLFYRLSDAGVITGY